MSARLPALSRSMRGNSACIPVRVRDVSVCHVRVSFHVRVRLRARILICVNFVTIINPIRLMKTFEPTCKFCLLL